MTISTMQALLLGLLTWLLKSTFSPDLFFYYQRPLICSLFVGMIMGDMNMALAAGISIQLVYIGVMVVGSVLPADSTFAGVIGCALAVVLRPTLGLEAAISAGLSAAVVVGAPAATFNTIKMSIDTAFFNEKSKAAALKGNLRAQRLWQWVPSQVFLFIAYVPLVFLMTKGMGNEGFIDGLTKVLTPVSDHLAVMAGVMPAVGIALALRSVINLNTLPYMVLGFVLTSYLELPILGVTIIAVCVVSLLVLADIRKSKEMERQAADDGIEDI